MQIWLKGVVSPLDIELAIAQSVDGISISNHGGRQLDGMPATMDVLEECAKVARGRIPVPSMAVSGYKGQDGVELAIKIFMHELQATMAIACCRTVADIIRDYVRRMNDAETIPGKL
ncbi:FMN-dependent dehydrogenase-domain-containing protein [Dendryphion nanum]|uniref:FMN-dependent dehydrogenase-domain-containing protein n=1 Tax=Dendryphion nanum TaxID=256645 RepID=A0A9P9DIH5_9PLEO|nr:FMN-dependent dehydrogenase-domain-containing protein [Dendryphion nanum]